MQPLGAKTPVAALAYSRQGIHSTGVNVAGASDSVVR